MTKTTKQVKVGDVKTVNDVEYICKGFTSNGKPMWRKNEIEKAHNVGDAHPSKPWVWTEYKPGKFDWRPVKKKDGDAGKTGGAATSTQQQQPKSQNQGQTQPSTDGAKKSGKQTAQQQQPKKIDKKVEDMTPDELAEYAKDASTEALAKVVNDKNQDKGFRQLAFNELKKRDDYDPESVFSEDLEDGFFPIRKPTIEYKKKKPEIPVNSYQIKDYETQSNTGRIKVGINKTRANYRNRTDDQILGTLNDVRARYQLRQLAYEEAMARGIPEDKINVRGTLESFWKDVAYEKQMQDAKSKPLNPEEGAELVYDWKGLDHEAIMHDEFDDGEDPIWLDDNSDKVKRIFHTDTLSGRQRYDTFKDYYQRNPDLVPYYLNATQKVDMLNGDMYEWAKSDVSPLFVSAGGAGAGKTYGWKEIVAKHLNLPELKPGQDPSNGDWGYVMLSNEQAEDKEKFTRTLAKYNGTYIDSNGNEKPHILVFDDSDKLLITKSKDLIALMKKINDGEPSNRIFTNPDTGQQEVWRGKIIIMTNKDSGKLQAGNEDVTAIFSRGTVSDIRFTRNETMELLANRYMTMALPKCQNTFEEQNFTDEEIEDFRQDIYNYMSKHIGDADPAKFTPRAFLNIAEHVAPRWKGSKVIRTGKGNIGVDLPWQVTALSIIKAENNDIEKANEDSEFSNENMKKTKERVLKRIEQAKKDGSYEALYGMEAQNAMLFGDPRTEEEKKKDEKKEAKQDKKNKKEETKKGFDDEMSLAEAESLLFG